MEHGFYGYSPEANGYKTEQSPQFISFAIYTRIYVVILYTAVICVVFSDLGALGGVPDDIARSVLDLNPRSRVEDNHGLTTASSVCLPLNGTVEVSSKVTAGIEPQLTSGRATASLAQGVSTSPDRCTGLENDKVVVTLVLGNDVVKACKWASIGGNGQRSSIEGDRVWKCDSRAQEVGGVAGGSDESRLEVLGSSESSRVVDEVCVLVENAPDG